jgi:hypothetical protein
MRKFALFFLLIFIYTSSNAQDQPSSLQIKMWDNSLFSAVFGGDENGSYQRTYNVRSLAGGEYYLKIMQRDYDGIHTKFEGYIEIPAGSRVQATLLENGGLEISTLEDKPRTGFGLDLKSRMQGSSSKSGEGQTNTKEEERNLLIQPLEFTDLHNNMTRARTDQVRDSIAVTGLHNNLFTTSYVVQMAKLFRNETSRLEFAKSAYTRVVDPENYFQVKMLFDRKENADSLDAYMQQKEGQTQKREFQGLF